MGFKQHISRTWQMIEQQVNDVPFRPDDETLRLIEVRKSIHLTPIDVGKRAEAKKSHDLKA